jgi:hypothetical protein
LTLTKCWGTTEDWNFSASEICPDKRGGLWWEDTIK